MPLRGKCRKRTPGVVGQVAKGSHRRPAYRLTDLGTLGGPTSRAAHVNAAGQVVGASTTKAGATHAFFYTDGAMKDLGAFGGSASQAFGVNNKGQVVGYAETNAGQPRAFLYSGGVLKNLGTFGGPDSTAYGINDAGQVAGAAQDRSGASHAFLYANGRMIDLDPAGGGSWAYRVNSAGQVAGYAIVHDEVTHAVLFAGAAVVKDLGSFGGATTFARGINGSGQVAGTSNLAGSAALHAFLYTSGTGMKDLGTLGGSSSYGEDVNDDGQVVGAAEDSSGALHAFLYDGKTMIDLNALINPASGWTLVSAMAINGSGQIAGYGTLRENERAFLLTPLAKARDAGAADVGTTVELSPQHQVEPATSRGDRRRSPMN